MSNFLKRFRPRATSKMIEKRREDGYADTIEVVRSIICCLMRVTIRDLSFLCW